MAHVYHRSPDLNVSVRVHPANLEADRETINLLLSKNLGHQCDSSRFDWLYLNNPHGKAISWLATSNISGDVVGVASLFPRRMWVRGKEELACVLGDFCVAPDYRSLGPALQLQRACLSMVQKGALFSFGYDFPSTVMMSIYRRLHVPHFDDCVRFIKPLLVDRLVRHHIKVPSLSRRLGDLANKALAGWDYNLKSNAFEYRLHEESCGTEFSELCQRVAKDFGICVDHSATYLNWRYKSHPFRRYEMLTAYKNRLEGYAVICIEGLQAHLVDLFGTNDPLLFRALVLTLCRRLRERGIEALNFYVLNTHRWVQLALRLGFWRRESCPVVVCTSSEDNDRPWIGVGSNWLLMQGDRES